jgi:serine/threonine protein kinase
MIFRAGNSIEHIYQFKEVYEGGGMGMVYRAHHIAWDIDVAIKHPRPNFLKSQSQIDEFKVECSTWAAIGLDPYIATCYYSLEIEGMPCVVAEFMPGGSLQDSIQRKDLYRNDEDESLARILTIAASSAWGLSRAHWARLIHCDIKPGNMLLSEHGTAKIADFGLAVAFRPSKPDAKAAGLTVAFASPEQIRGEPLTPASDVWSWAASMLVMFNGGVTWENGAACGAVLAEFMNEGGKAYRIPPIPASIATLLGECFRFTPDARISDFDQIAERVCQCYEELFEEPCPASKPDLELISADSLNNRSVSRFDLGDLLEVHRLLDDALSVDPLHPEANFNSALLEYTASGKYHTTFLDQLAQAAKFDLGEYRPYLYLACLLNADQRMQEALDCYAKARGIAAAHEVPEIQRLWDLSNQRKLNPILAPPISGEDFSHDSARFNRLMAKSELAIREQRLDDARRYLLMSGDIPGFARHPKRRRLLQQIEV